MFKQLIDIIKVRNIIDSKITINVNYIIHRVHETEIQIDNNDLKIIIIGDKSLDSDGQMKMRKFIVSRNDIELNYICDYTQTNLKINDVVLFSIHEKSHDESMYSRYSH